MARTFRSPTEASAVCALLSLPAPAQHPRDVDVTLEVVASGLPETPRQKRDVQLNKIAYGHKGAPYKDNKAVLDDLDAAEKAMQASSASPGQVTSATDRLMQSNSEEAQRKRYRDEMKSQLDTGGLQHMEHVLAYWTERPRLRKHFDSRKVVQDELRSRSKMEEALFELDKHLGALVNGAGGLSQYETAVFTIGSNTANWEKAYVDVGNKFLNVLHGLQNTSKKENSLFTHIDIGFLSQKAWGATFLATSVGDLAHAKKMAGVLTTLNAWRALVEHVLLRRLPSLKAAMRTKAGNIGNLRSTDPAYAAAVAKNLEEMAKARDSMPPLPNLLRMVHYGYSSSGCEDESARIEARVVDFNAFVGERPAGFWAQPGRLGAPAAAAPSL